MNASPAFGIVGALWIAVAGAFTTRVERGDHIMSNELKIDPRPGLEVFANKGGLISISQDGQYGEEDQIVAVHPDDVDRLCKMLEFVRDEISRNPKE